MADDRGAGGDRVVDGSAGGAPKRRAQARKYGGLLLLVSPGSACALAEGDRVRPLTTSLVQDHSRE